MNKRCTLSGSFEHFGAEPKNPRWSWSALTPDYSTVVLTLWKDMISFVDKVPHYDDPAPNFEKWKDTPGNRDRLWPAAGSVDRHLS